MKRLLLADDSITIQKVIGITFANDDFNLTIVGDGDSAFDKAKASPPDLVLADVFMPGKNGYELCEAIKRTPELQHIPVLLLTGTFEAFDEDRAKAAGADAWIAKPFESQALISRVLTLLEQGGAAAPAAAVAAPAVAPAPVAAPAPEPAPAAVPEPQAAEEDVWGEEVSEEVAEGDDVWGTVSFDEEEETTDSVETDGDIWGDVDLEEESLEEPLTPADAEDEEEEVVFLEDDDILIEEEEIAEASVEDVFADEPEVEEVAETVAPPAQPVPAAAAPAPAPVAAAPVAVPGGGVQVSAEMVEQIVRETVASIIERIAWEVVPDLAESLIKDEIRKIKEQLRQ